MLTSRASTRPAGEACPLQALPRPELPAEAKESAGQTQVLQGTGKPPMHLTDKAEPGPSPAAPTVPTHLQKWEKALFDRTGRDEFSV